MAGYCMEADMSTLRQSAFISFPLLAALLIGGCAGSGPRTGPDSSAKLSQPQQPAGESSQQARDLAEQAQLDVEDFLALREEGRSSAGESSADSPAGAAAANPPGPPAIVWNQPDRSAARSASVTPPAEDEQEPFVISPMFRDPPELEEVTDPAAAADAAAVDPLQPDRLQQLMVELSVELRRTAAHSDSPLPYLLAISSLALADPQRTLDPQTLYDLSEEERELFANLQMFFSQAGTNLTGCDDPKETIAEAVGELRELLAGELKVPTAELCYSVTGFGIYKTFNEYAFLARSGQQVIVYLEIDDFNSELNDKGQWVTEISQLLTIYGNDGLAVWGGRDWATAVDAANNKRRDFFTVQTITLPDALGVGKYMIKIRARDEKTGAEAERTIPFEMVADPNLAARLPKS